MFGKKKSDKNKNGKKDEPKKKVEEKVEVKKTETIDPLPISTARPVSTEKKPEPKVLYKVFTPCPHCKRDTKGEYTNCVQCKNTRKQLKEWAEEV